jgi:hypothetical protein
MTHTKHKDRDAVSKRIRVQFIKREIETAFNLIRVALAEHAAGHIDAALKAQSRARKTYDDFRKYLALVNHHLSRAEKGECEHSLENLGNALRALE